jgi:hypothetical protein
LILPLALCLIARSARVRIALASRPLRRHSPTKKRVGSFLLSMAARDPLFADCRRRRVAWVGPIGG